MSGWPPGSEAREDWLALVDEPVLDPDRDIVDPHFHFYPDRAGYVYELDAFGADTGSGHRIVEAIEIECNVRHDADAEPGFGPVGETRYVNALADVARDRGAPTQITGIVSRADLRLPHLDAVLDAHLAASSRVKGIRHSGACDPDPQALAIPGRGTPGLYADPAFRAGLARLGARGLTYDTWQYHHQCQDFLDLARAVPDTTLILDHCATPLGVGRFAGQREAIFATWKDDMARIAECPNVMMKLGGMAMLDNGFGWEKGSTPPDSKAFAETYAPWFEHVIILFGADRCMFESNFPVERTSVSYKILWNAFKRIAADYPREAQDALFAGTARKVYRL